MGATFYVKFVDWKTKPAWTYQPHAGGMAAAPGGENGDSFHFDRE